MSMNAELALASRVLNALNDQLPEGHKLDLMAEWDVLVDAVNDSRSEGSALLAIGLWRDELRTKVAARQLHAPLEEAKK